MPNTFLSSEQERKMKSFKRRLETWREILVALHPILLWTKPLYPAGIVGLSTFMFLLHWYWNPSIVTTISLTFMIVNVVDFVIPRVSSVYFPPQQWTAVKEKTFENICQSLAGVENSFSTQLAKLKDYKYSHPKRCFVIITSLCFSSAWIGHLVNNWVIGYLFVTLLALYPGAKHNGVIEKVISSFFVQATDQIRTFTQKDKMKST